MNLFKRANFLFAAAALAIAPATFAATVTLTVGPDTVPDEQQPQIANDAPAGFGPTSWGDSATGKVNWHARHGEDGDYLTSLFGAKAATLTINDIASISYNVKSTTEHWFLKIYTRKDNVADQATWYGYSFTNDYGTIAEDGTWQTWSTATGRFDLDERSGQGAGTTFLNWTDFQTTYGNELVEMISVQTDSGLGTAGLMDGLVITLDDGSVGRVDFSDIQGAQVPTPSIAMAGMGLMGLLALRRR